MQKSAHKTIEPHAYDPLIHEGFIRQADLVKAVQESLQGLTDLEGLLIDKDRKSTRLNSSHIQKSRMPSSA